MADFPNQHPRHRYLAERIVVTGELVLIRPAHFGNGDKDELTDLPLLLNEVDNRALITGASLAGALRNYLRERQRGYEFPMSPRDPMMQYYKEWTGTEGELFAASLFGGHRGDPEGEQSPLIVDDALSVEPGLPLIERRDGVAIDAATHTAEDKKKYDYELLTAGTRFNLRFELLLEHEDETRNYRDHEDKKAKIEKVRKENGKRLQALALALQALANADGEIRLGARKRRGFGCCEVKEWTVTRYQLHQPADLLAWLAADHESWLLNPAPKPKSGEKIAELLSEIADSLTAKPDLKKAPDDHREWFEIKASFAVDGSLMVRSGFEDPDELDEKKPENADEEPRVKRRPDFVHLRTRAHKTGDNQPVLPGTSLAGALRQRAQRIANTLVGAANSKKAENLIDEMFGPREIKSGPQLRASRITINEEFVEQSRALVQTRIKLDRFTGGTLESALLEEEPSFGGQVSLGLKLYIVPDSPGKASAKAEVGLLLLVLKDLWLSDLPLGGEAAIGRGRLCGKSATLKRKPFGKSPIVIKLQANGSVDPASDESAEFLEAHVRALHQWAEGEAK